MGKIYDGSNFFMKLKMHGYFVLSCRRILIGRHRCERSGRLGGLQHHPGHRRLCPRRPGALHAQLVLRLPVSTHAGIPADRVSDPHLLLCGSESGSASFHADPDPGGLSLGGSGSETLGAGGKKCL